LDNPAYDKALKFLARRDHFRAELAEKLHRKGFEAGDVNEAIDRLVELDVINDERLASRFAELRSVSSGWGPARLVMELRKRGVDRPLAERASRLEPGLHDRALATAVRRVAARAKPGWWRVSERCVRLVSSLIGRGFEADVAHAAVRELAAEMENSTDETHDQLGDPGHLS
jgi:regulatory protein